MALAKVPAIAGRQAHRLRYLRICHEVQAADQCQCPGPIRLPGRRRQTSAGWENSGNPVNPREFAGAFARLAAPVPWPSALPIGSFSPAGRHKISAPFRSRGLIVCTVLLLRDSEPPCPANLLSGPAVYLALLLP